jgi:hypothetical protein
LTLKQKSFICLLALLIILAFSSQSVATVEWDIPRTFNLKTPPLDVAMSRSGTWIFVLTDQGKILVYSSKGSLDSTIDIGKQVDQIEAGPVDELLILKSRKDKTVQLLTLDFVKTIDISGSPFKGSADAPVIIAVFSEFQ